MYSSSVVSLNYQHLERFWAVVREGGVTRASQRLHVSQPTVSAQVRKLEETLGEKLLVRAGRGVALTDAGRAIYRYADEIFSLGRELIDTARDGTVRRPMRLTVGVADVMPKLIAYRILEPALQLPEPVQLECMEDTPERLLAELAVNELDMVLADAPVGPGVKVRAYSHLLGECGVSIFASPRLAEAHRRRFPRSLEGAPFLLPQWHAAVRPSLDRWFEQRGIRPRIVGTFQDSALLEAFGQAGAGLFPVPSAMEDEVRRQYGVRLVGRLETVREQFYVITVDRKLRHPAVLAISEEARRKLFE